jgi:hypothetical protein
MDPISIQLSILFAKITSRYLDVTFAVLFFLFFLLCKSLLAGYSLWIVGDTSRSTLSSFFPNTLINIDASFRVVMDNERHTDSKMAHRHGTQYFTAV